MRERERTPRPGMADQAQGAPLLVGGAHTTKDGTHATPSTKTSGSKKSSASGMYKHPKSYSKDGRKVATHPGHKWSKPSKKKSGRSGQSRDKTLQDSGTCTPEEQGRVGPSKKGTTKASQWSGQGVHFCPSSTRMSQGTQTEAEESSRVLS